MCVSLLDIVRQNKHRSNYCSFANDEHARTHVHGLNKQKMICNWRAICEHVGLQGTNYEMKIAMITMY